MSIIGGSRLRKEELNLAFYNWVSVFWKANMSLTCKKKMSKQKIEQKKTTTYGPRPQTCCKLIVCLKIFI